jgi:hypothetical protein
VVRPSRKKLKVSSTAAMSPCERAEAAVRDLNLDVAADRTKMAGSGLVDGDARAGRLRALGTANLEQAAACIDDGDHDSVAVLRGVLLGRGHHRVDGATSRVRRVRVGARVAKSWSGSCR